MFSTVQAGCCGAGCCGGFNVGVCMCWAEADILVGWQSVRLRSSRCSVVPLEVQTACMLVTMSQLRENHSLIHSQAETTWCTSAVV